jgi:hypothetical protein
MEKYPLVYDSISFIGPNVSHIVYGWTENNVPCYIGVTKQTIKARIHSHLNNGKECFFQAKLRAHPERFKCYILAQSNNYEELKDWETNFICLYDTYHYDNPNAYNLTLGGEGNSGFRYTNASKKKMAIAAIGRKHTNATKDKLSKIGRGRKHTEATRAQMSSSHKGIVFTASHIANIGKAKGSPEARQKMRDVWTPEMKEKAHLCWKQWYERKESVAA